MLPTSSLVPTRGGGCISKSSLGFEPPLPCQACSKRHPHHRAPCVVFFSTQIGDEPGPGMRIGKAGEISLGLGCGGSGLT